MKAEELRIGNKLLNDGVIATIDARSIFDIWNKEGLKNYKPIPLTEDNLLKFKNIKESVFYDGNHNKGFYLGESQDFTIVSFEDGIFCYEMTDGESWGYVGKKIEFLHELQNIFYWYNNQKIELI